jgi:hypothetical protein
LLLLMCYPPIGYARIDADAVTQITLGQKKPRDSQGFLFGVT